MTERCVALLVALLLSSCASASPYPVVCLAPVNLNFGSPLPSYYFEVSGSFADGAAYANAGNCPGTFSGGSCDERGISLRDIDNVSLVIDLTLSVESQVVLEQQLSAPALPGRECETGTRELFVTL